MKEYGHLIFSLCFLLHVVFQVFKGKFGVFAVFGEADKKNTWGAIFDVEDPRSRVVQSKGKVLDVFQALEVARHDIQYCDWRARQDVLTIMLLHEMVSANLCYCYIIFI
jgi:hypothetical protein